MHHRKHYKSVQILVFGGMEANMASKSKQASAQADQYQLALRKTEEHGFTIKMAKKEGGGIDIQLTFEGMPVTPGKTNKEIVLKCARLALGCADQLAQKANVPIRNRADKAIAIYEKANSLFEGILELDKGNLEARTGRDASKLRIVDHSDKQMTEIGLLNAGIDLYKESLELNKLASNTSNATLAKFCFDLGSETISLFDRVLMRNPTDMEAMLWKARALHSIGHKAPAMQLLKIVISSSPQNIEALELEAEIQMETGELGDALETIAHSLDIDPNNYSALIQKGDILEMKGHRRKALKSFIRAESIDPANIKAKWRITALFDEIKNSPPSKERDMEDADKDGDQIEEEQGNGPETGEKGPVSGSKLN